MENQNEKRLCCTNETALPVYAIRTIMEWLNHRLCGGQMSGDTDVEF